MIKKILTLLTTAYLTLQTGCAWRLYFNEVGECREDIQNTIDDVVDYGLNPNMDEFNQNIEEIIENPELDAKDISELVKERYTLCGDAFYPNASAGIYAYNFRQEITINKRTDDEMVIFMENAVILDNGYQDVLKISHSYDEARNAREYFSLDEDYILNTESIKDKIRNTDKTYEEERDAIKSVIKDFYNMVQDNGGTIVHEYTHMALDENGYTHYDEVKVKEYEVSYEETIMTEKDKAMDLIEQVYYEVKAEAGEE
ncbi:MAG: hypothetical protein ABIJ18_00165 [archaeon]